VCESEKLSHRPFAALEGELGQQLKQRLRKRRKEQREEVLTGAAGQARPPNRGGPPGPGTSHGPGPDGAAVPASPQEEARFFQSEMAGVRPLQARGNYIPDQRPKTTPPVQDDDAEAMAQLADLVDGRVSFDFTASDERIEGISMGLDRRLLRRLRRANFAVQAHLDLHGLTRQEARPLVESFIADARARRRRCVLIVHGRGLNSKDQIPVLKEGLRVWLAKGRIARSVLAFCSARPSDGGAGAVYVLLRK
jgi:DNA-nicking Smr family endonuclease